MDTISKLFLNGSRFFAKHLLWVLKKFFMNIDIKNMTTDELKNAVENITYWMDQNSKQILVGDK